MALTWKTFNANKMIFEDVKKCESDIASFQRIFVKYDYEDGKLPGKLSIRTPELFSWGIQENGKNYKAPSSATNPVEGYTMSFVMFNKDRLGGPTEDELKTIEMFEQILTKCKQHLKLPQTKAAMGKYQIDPLVDLMSIFYRKQERGEFVPGYAPTMYPKLYTKFEKTRIVGNKPEIVTGFYSRDNVPIEPSTLVGVKCNVIGEIIVDNIYVGAKPSIQVLLNDAIITEQFTRQRQLFISSVAEDEADAKPTSSVFNFMATSSTTKAASAASAAASSFTNPLETVVCRKPTS